IRDMALQAKPIVMIGLILAPPTALIILAAHIFKSTCELFVKETDRHQVEGCLRLRQNIDKSTQWGPRAFFHSPVFSWSLLLVYAAGIPAFFSYWLYCTQGIDPLLGFPSKEKEFITVFLTIGLYIGGLSWCLMPLFFFHYFSLPWNFTSTEYDIEI